MIFFSISNEKICKCGYPNSRHKHSPEEKANDDWTMERNTIEQIDPEYGTIGKSQVK